MSKEGKKTELFQTLKLQIIIYCSHDQYRIVMFKSIMWALVYAIIIIIKFFKEKLLQESELLTFWGKPPYQPFSKQHEEESRLYKIPSLKTGLSMCSVLIFQYIDSFSCCNILARLLIPINYLLSFCQWDFYEVEFLNRM